MLPRDERRARARRRSRRRGMIPIDALVAAGVTVALLGLSFLYVAQSTALRDLTAQLTQAQHALNREQEISRILTAQIEEAFSWERVSRIARDELGMIDPPFVTYLVISADDND